MKTEFNSRILLLVFGLLGFGLIQVYSTSFIFSQENFGDGMYFFKRQSLFAALGFAGIMILRRLPLSLLLNWGWLLWLMASLGVVLTLVPGLGVAKGGAYRWIPVGFGFDFEPSELLKVTLPFMIYRYFRIQWKELTPGNIFFRLFVLFAPILLLLKQPDFGSFTICCTVLFLMVFLMGLPWRIIFTAITFAVPVFYFLVMTVPYRRARISAFLNPWENPESQGFQLIQSLLSFRAGGLGGVGLGDGQGKLFFLPAAHTDFTLSVLGEELGFVGFFLLLMVFGYLIFLILSQSFSLKDQNRKVLATGLSLVFCLSVIINICVSLGLLPTKGLTLPFLSYGGCSLLMNCFLFGLLLNIFEQSKFLKRKTRKRA